MTRLLLILTLFLGCSLDSSVPSGEPDASPPDAYPPDARISSSLWIEGDYIGVEKYGVISCTMNGNRLGVFLDFDDRGKPHLRGRPDTTCQSVGEEILIVHCRGVVHLAWFNYFDDFLFRLRLDEYRSGIFQWWIDGHGFFGCQYNFWIDLIEDQ